LFHFLPALNTLLCWLAEVKEVHCCESVAQKSMGSWPIARQPTNLPKLLSLRNGGGFSSIHPTSKLASIAVQEMKSGHNLKIFKLIT
jgi:hypothetical protein